MRKGQYKYEPLNLTCSCGKEFTVPGYDTGRKYCSRECWLKYHKEEIYSDRDETRTCACGNTFKTSKKSKKRFCSMHCKEYRKACNFGGNKSKKRIPREERTCYCGKKFIVTVNSTQKCCSQSCGSKRPRKTKGTKRSKRIKYKCLYCSKEMEDTEFKVKNKKCKKYCSTGCYLEAMKLDEFYPDKKDKISNTLKTKYASGELISKCKGKTYEEMFGDKAEEHLQKVLFNNRDLGTKGSSWERRIVELNIENVDYVGDRKFWIRFEGRYKNPDFVIRPFKETRKVIEVLGSYWHPPEEVEELKRYYEANDIKYLFLYDDDFKRDNKFIQKVIEYARS